MPKSQVGDNGGYEAIQNFSNILGTNHAPLGITNVGQGFDDQNDILKNSLFSEFLDESLINSVQNIVPAKFQDTIEQTLAKDHEYNIMSKSDQDDVIMSASEDSDRLSCLNDSDDNKKPPKQDSA